jgi:hypothetical protein
LEKFSSRRFNDFQTLVQRPSHNGKSRVAENQIAANIGTGAKAYDVRQEMAKSFFFRIIA